MRRSWGIGLVSAIVVASVTFIAEPAFAVRTISVSPNAGLLDLDTVTVTVEGFNPGALTGMCQVVNVPPASPSNCGGAIALPTPDTSGAFTTDYVVRRHMYVSSLGRVVDCADPADEPCYIGAAEANDIAGTVVIAPITFATPPAPPAVRGSITITPAEVTANEDAVVEGSGFRPNARIEVLQCTPAPLDPTNCNANPIQTMADADGNFTATVVISGFVSTSTSSIQCPLQNCVIAAAEVVDVPNTIVTQPLTFAPPLQPDAFIKTVGASTTEGDNIYNTTGAFQDRRHAIAPGGKWSFALRFQNDGNVTDDFVVTAEPSSGPITVRYFIGYFDVTDQVTGAGFVLNDVAPGEVRKLPVQFRDSGGATAGTTVDRLVFVTSTAVLHDAVKVGVRVSSA